MRLGMRSRTTVTAAAAVPTAYASEPARNARNGILSLRVKLTKRIITILFAHFVCLDPDTY